MTYSRELFNDDVMRYVYLVLPFHEVLLIQLPSDLCHRQLHKHSLCKQCSLSDPKSFNLKIDTIFYKNRYLQNCRDLISFQGKIFDVYLVGLAPFFRASVFQFIGTSIASGGLCP